MAIGATWNFNVGITVTNETQSIAVQNFGRAVLATEDVEVGFTEAYRLYTSNSAAQNDADLSAGAKLDAAEFFSQNLRPPDLMIAAVTYASLDTDLDALLVENSDFYGVTCADRTKATQLLLAAWAAANSRIAAVQSLDADITAGTVGNLFETISGLSNDRAFGVWHDDNLESVDLTWMATILSADLDSQSSVAHDKQLVGMSVPPSTAIDDTKRAQVETYNGNIYLPFYGANVMRPGTMFGGLSIEEKIIEDWYEARLGEAFARLAVRRSNANSKIPYDDFGIADVEAEIRAVTQVGVDAGHFVADTLVLDVPKLADISAAVRATKKLTIAGTVTKAGSIKDLDFNVGITF
jgi:hypothetical protein